MSGESSFAFPSAALMPPSAAPEWLRVGCSFEIIATSAPASCAAMAARMPAQPAPTTRTSCSPITCCPRYPIPLHQESDDRSQLTPPDTHLARAGLARHLLLLQPSHRGPARR